MFTKFDKSGREPRDVQLKALRWLRENWHKADVFGLRLDTGSGKSAIAKAIIEEFGGHVITPSNALLDQYSQTYPEVPAVKGYNNFMCKRDTGLDCVAAKCFSGRYCADCPAAAARRRALNETKAFFNPVSYRSLQLQKGFTAPSVVVVDEAHTLPGMALIFAEEKLLCKDYRMPHLKTAIDIHNWAKNRVVELKERGEQAFKAGLFKEADRLAAQYRKLFKIEHLFKNAQNYVWEYRKEWWRGKQELVFYMHPIDPPPELVGKILRADKVVLMSATLFPSDIEKMLPGAKFKYLDLPSPIDKDRRQIIWRPMESANATTDPAQVAAWIQEQLKLHPGNAIVHVSYAWAAKLRPFSFYTVANFESGEKLKAIEKFKREGGVFLAAGCAEGLDLPYDQCRVNLIPILHKANIGDVVVKKRLLRPGGQREYDLDIIRTTIQQTGRSTRAADDYSVTVIGDPQLYPLVQRYKKDIPQSFREAIKWEK